MSYDRDSVGRFIMRHQIVAIGKEGVKCLKDTVLSMLRNRQPVFGYRRGATRISIHHNKLNNEVTVNLNVEDREEMI